MKKELENALKQIGLALSSSHNCIVTDDPDAEPAEKSWRTDHTKELAALELLEAALRDS